MNWALSSIFHAAKSRQVASRLRTPDRAGRLDRIDASAMHPADFVASGAMIVAGATLDQPDFADTEPGCSFLDSLPDLPVAA